ncbi:MAG TPA: DUF4388 domain-containing protein [Blastocatellia bacterium]|nr:DUF4388 domain-containing protein [Blastocatellia bacterium]
MIRGRDRREAKRISYICEVECEASGINHLSTRIIDLSTTGAFIDSMTTFAPGTIIKLKFKIKDILIDADAEVRYSMPQMGMGVRFLNLKTEHLSALEHLIEGKPLVLPKPEPTGIMPSIPPDEALPHQAVSMSSQNMLQGNFAVVSFFDIIQIIENNRLTGALAVTSPSATGSVYFKEGLIVGARSGQTVGQDALVKFLDTTEGVFQFNRSEVELKPTIQTTSNLSLMLDLLRIKDEEAALL